MSQLFLSAVCELTADMLARFSNTISVTFNEFKSLRGRLFYVPTQRANACVYEHDETFNRSYANSQADSQVSGQLEKQFKKRSTLCVKEYVA